MDYAYDDMETEDFYTVLDLDKDTRSDYFRETPSFKDKEKDGKKNKKGQKHQSTQEDFEKTAYHAWMKEKMKRNMQYIDTSCPAGEMYVKWLHRGNYDGTGTSSYAHELRTLDVKIRPLDKMVFYTGIFYLNLGFAQQTECFIAKMNS